MQAFYQHNILNDIVIYVIDINPLYELAHTSHNKLRIL